MRSPLGWMFACLLARQRFDLLKLLWFMNTSRSQQIWNVIAGGKFEKRPTRSSDVTRYFAVGNASSCNRHSTTPDTTKTRTSVKNVMNNRAVNAVKLRECSLRSEKMLMTTRTQIGLRANIFCLEINKLRSAKTYTNIDLSVVFRLTAFRVFQ